MSAVPLAFDGKSKEADATPFTTWVTRGATVPSVLEMVTGVPSRMIPAPRLFLTVTRTLLVLPQFAVPGTVTETWLTPQLLVTTPVLVTTRPPVATPQPQLVPKSEAVPNVPKPQPQLEASNCAPLKAQPH